MDGAPVKMNRYSLKFEQPELEHDFLRHQQALALGQVRGSLVVLFVALIALNSANLSHPENSYSFGVAAGGTLLLAMITAFSFNKHFPKVFVPAMAVVGLGFSIDLAAQQALMAGQSETFRYQQTLSYEILMTLNVLFMFTLTGIGFRRAVYAAAPGALIWLAVAAWDGAHHLGLYVFLITGFGLAAAAGRLIDVYQRRDFVRSRMLAAEQERSEGLLRILLPVPIIGRLKAGENPIADRFEQATILFEDVVGFTDRSAREEPEATVAFLNDMFSAFDEIAADLHLQPIKTTGDAYMVAGGVPVERPDNVAAVAEMALRMQEALGAINARRGTNVQIRVGIHTGPVAAAVVGTKKLSYEVWGDTVNTASRMETTGAPGRIHVSEAVRAKLGEAYRFEARGSVEVKGKGSMETFFLLGRAMPVGASA